MPFEDDLAIFSRFTPALLRSVIIFLPAVSFSLLPFPPLPTRRFDKFYNCTRPSGTSIFIADNRTKGKNTELAGIQRAIVDRFLQRGTPDLA